MNLFKTQEQIQEENKAKEIQWIQEKRKEAVFQRVKENEDKISLTKDNKYSATEKAIEKK